MKRSLSPSLVLFLCAFAFLAGRLLNTLNHLPTSQQDGFSVVQQHPASDLHHHHQQQPLDGDNRRQNLAIDGDGALQQQSHPPDFQSTSFDEALQPLLADRAPLRTSSTGVDRYVTQPVQQLSWYPRLYVWPKFLSPTQCQQLINVAESRLAPSALALRSGETEEGTRNIRTSQGTFMTAHDDPTGTLTFIEDKIALLTGVPKNYGEAFNLLRYHKHQHYDSHYDYFDETGYGAQSSNRLATVLVYLTTVEEGGETIFPFEGRNGLEHAATINYKSCDIGFKYKPRVGDALLFYSMYPNNTLDRHSLHGGCPVMQGTKWVATKWIRNKCYGNCAPTD